MRAEVEQYLTDYVRVPSKDDLDSRGYEDPPASLGCYGAAFRLLLTSDTAPVIGPMDLVRTAWEPCWLKEFNPFLDDDSVTCLQDAAQLWLKLCVLDDRLGRLMEHSTPGSEKLGHLIQVCHAICIYAIHVCAC